MTKQTDTARTIKLVSGAKRADLRGASGHPPASGACRGGTCAGAAGVSQCTATIAARAGGADQYPPRGRVSGRAPVAGKVFCGRHLAGEDEALAPTIYQSGAVRQLGRINRDGRQEVRRVLLQCAHTVVRIKSHGAKPLQQFFLRIARRCGKKIAIVALARKLLTTAHGVLKSEQPYDPRRLQPA
ncbi:MAG: transposase [Nitrospira sp.]|nr:transposase [Nitrospira sp.]